MARTTSIAPDAPISPTAEMVPGSNGFGARVRRSSPRTLGEFERRLRGDRRATALLANDPTRLHELASSLLQEDERARELFADVETLAAYLRALIDKWRRRPYGTPKTQNEQEVRR